MLIDLSCFETEWIACIGHIFPSILTWVMWMGIYVVFKALQTSLYAYLYIFLLFMKFLPFSKIIWSTWKSLRKSWTSFTNKNTPNFKVAAINYVNYHVGTLTIFTLGIMFKCHLCRITGWSHIWLNIILSVSVMVILGEVNIYINRLSKAESEST